MCSPWSKQKGEKEVEREKERGRERKREREREREKERKREREREKKQESSIPCFGNPEVRVGWRAELLLFQQSKAKQSPSSANFAFAHKRCVVIAKTKRKREGKNWAYSHSLFLPKVVGGE